jgi:pyruvate kinase
MDTRPSKTKIVATIGPASNTQPVMERLIRAGMTVARLNFSHGDFEGHRAVVSSLRAAARAVGRRVAIMADLPGPKMRIGELAGEPVTLRPGDRIELTTRQEMGHAGRVSVSFPRLALVVKPGDALYLNDGIIHLVASAVQGDTVACEIVAGGELRSRKGLNLPGIDLGMSAFTDRDRECLEFALSVGVDAVSQSFVATGADVRAVREAAAALGRRPFVIAKIERAIALDHVDDILGAADGVMIARGDLGVEIPIERIAVVQKRLTREAHLRGKPVITATQMLESMIASSRPTRAEATDVANAVFDGTDAVMLSGESAVGQYPVEAVAMLGRIAREVEPFRPGAWVRRRLHETAAGAASSATDVLALSIESAVERLAPKCVIAATLTGNTARNITRFRLPAFVLGVSTNEETCQHLLFSYGVVPVHVTELPEDWRAYARDWVVSQGEEPAGVVIVCAGPSPRRPEASPRMEIVDLGVGA